MATVYAEIEVWVVIDEGKDYATGATAQEAHKAYSDAYGLPSEDDEPRGMRVVKITARVPVPEPIEVTAVVVEDDEPAAG